MCEKFIGVFIWILEKRRPGKTPGPLKNLRLPYRLAGPAVVRRAHNLANRTSPVARKSPQKNTVPDVSSLHFRVFLRL